MKAVWIILILIFISIMAGITGCIEDEGNANVPEVTTSPTEENQTTSEQNEELEVKAYLVKKYDPGLCFGMPGIPSDNEVSTILSQYPGLEIFVKENFRVRHDFEISNIIKQFLGIKLTKTDFGYTFMFEDGKCCNIHTYEGKVMVNGEKITDEVTNKSTRNVPC